MIPKLPQKRRSLCKSKTKGGWNHSEACISCSYLVRINPVQVIGTSDGLSHQDLPSHQMALEALDASAAHGLLHRLVHIPGGRALVT